MYKFIKPEVLKASSYHLADVPARIKINQNENPFDLPPEIKERALRILSERPWGRYPEFVPLRFLKRLSEAVNWPAEGLSVGNGSNELIAALLAITLERGRKLLICEPTFSMYRQLATTHAANVIAVPMTEDFGFDMPAVLEAIEREQPTVVILCSPNNPTGAWLTFEQMDEIAGRFSGLLIFDEAYFEFCGITALGLVERHRNVAVLRTFSKAMSLAGLRVGYLMAAAELVDEVNKAKLPYNLNIFSMIAAECALDAAAVMQAQVEQIIAGRERLIAALGRIEGVRAYPSRANFVLFETRLAAEQIYTELLKRGRILIRNVSRPGRMERALRVSVGRPDENDEFLSTLAGILGTRG
ncbi:MAG: histidinol-phosphate transaminase [Acidobacteriota bacterium]